MAEPVSAGTATTLAVTGASLASVLPPTTASVVMGAFAGSIFLVVLSPQYSWKAKIGLFIASLFTGIIAADAVAAILNESTPDSVTPGSPLGAMVASFLSVRGLAFLTDWMNKKSGLDTSQFQKKDSENIGRDRDEQ